MKRHTIPITIILLLLATLGAVAAISTTPATATVTPLIHKQGSEGFFLIQLPQTAESAKNRQPFAVQINSGDIYLVTAEGKGLDTDGDKTAKKSGENSVPPIAISGRFGQSGPASLTLLRRTSEGSYSHYAKVAFELPKADTTAKPVVREWALQQQLALLKSDPQGADSFIYYWNIIAAPRYGISQRLPSESRRSRRETPDLYSIFSGAAAIQESLQLEQLDDGRQRSRTDDKGKQVQPPKMVPITSLSGPTVQSHPFKEMLKGKTPALPELSTLIPEDQYAVFFNDINRQIELADLMDEWGGNLLHQISTSAQNFNVRKKLSQQLCLENSQMTRWFGDRVIGKMAFTGQDPYFKEGTDFTVLFSLRDMKRFKKQIEKRYQDGVERGAKRSSFSIDGISGISVVTPDRRISSYMLIIGETGIVSNSKEALARIISTSRNRQKSLASADDFRYMRTIFQQDSAEEDVFIYLSDANIRKIVSAKSKIGEARRLRCAANMGLIANARLWFKAENRREATMAELIKGGYLGKQVPVCPDHGAYQINKSGEPHCSLHNHRGNLTPLVENSMTHVTPEEASEYREFVSGYNRYWSKFFDPIGIRVKLGQNIKIETCILPLIENSWYDGFANFSGKRAATVTESLVLPRTVMSFRAHMSKEWFNDTTRLERFNELGNLSLKWLGDEIAINLCDGQVFFSVSGQAMGMMGQEVGRSSSIEPLIFGYLGSAMNLPTYLTVKVTDPLTAEREIPLLFQSLAPRHSHSDEFSVETYTLENHNGKPIHVANFNIWLLKLRLYSAIIDDRLVIASRRDIITDLMDSIAGGKQHKPAINNGNMEMSIYRSAFKQLAETVDLGYQEDNRHACHKNLPLATLMLRNFGIKTDDFPAAAEQLRGFTPYCPSGGRYIADPISKTVTCSLHGSHYKSRQPIEEAESSATMRFVNSLEKINARMRFTEEGLMTTVEIKRKSR